MGDGFSDSQSHFDARQEEDKRQAKKMTQKPAVTRMVHYVNGKMVHQAAIITGVDANDDTLIGLQTFVNNHPEFNKFYDSVPYSDVPKPNTWHWPERV